MNERQQKKFEERFGTFAFEDSAQTQHYRALQQDGYSAACQDEEQRAQGLIDALERALKSARDWCDEARGSLPDDCQDGDYIAAAAVFKEYKGDAK